MRSPDTPSTGLPKALPKGLRFSDDATPYTSDRSGRRSGRLLGVAHPASLDDVEALVGWANEARVPLVPVSSHGGPRRRGDTISPRPALICDLSGMNRIVHADARDAVAVIEAGVTFPDLDAALAPHGLKAFRPLLPRASKSVLATFLEREPTTVPGHHWDSADPLAAMELVFGSGDRFRTGGAALPGTVEENIARGNRQILNSGPGQTDFGRMVQGAQGSLAIVGRASILCRRISTASHAWFVSADTLAPVIATAYAMLRTRPDGQLFVVNASQLALMLAEDAASFAALRAALPAWTMFVETSATGPFADEAMAYRNADLASFAQTAGALLSETVAGHAAAAFATMLDRSPTGSYKDVGGAHADVLFVSQLNRVGDQIEAVASVASASDMAIYLQPMTQGVNAHCEFTVLAPSPTAAATQARRLAERLADAGAFFSRPYHPYADLAFARDPGITPLLRQTKAIFDPQGVLQPQSQALGGASRELSAGMPIDAADEAAQRPAGPVDAVVATAW